MQTVLTLIADPAARKLSPEIAATASAALTQAGATVGVPDWLCETVACDLPFEGLPPDQAVAHARVALDRSPIDAVAQPVEGRRKTIVLCDMESTVIVNEMVDEMAKLMGVGPRVADITAKAMNGEIPFRDALRKRIALLGGLEESALYDLLDSIVFMPGAKTMVATLSRDGAYPVLVSGGFHIFADWVAEQAGFAEVAANYLVVHDGVVTGAVGEPLMGTEGKRAALQAIAGRMGRPLSDALAVGDGANDLAMLHAAGMGVAFRAKPAVADAAPSRIDHGDLTAVLYLQGYRRDEFAEV